METEKKCRFSYNDLDDSLIISCREENENVKSNFLIDNFIFNLTGRGKIVGMQVKNVSRVLQENNADSSILKGISAVNLIVARKENCLFIGLVIINGSKKANIPLRVFMPPLLNQN